MSAAEASSAAGTPAATTKTATPTPATDMSTATTTSSAAAAVVTTSPSHPPATTTTTAKAGATTTTPSMTTRTPSPSATSTTTPLRDESVAVRLPGGNASLSTVAAPAGVPPAVGVATVNGRTVLRVSAAMLGAAGPGSRIVVAGTAHLVTSVANAATADVGDLVAAAPAGAVVVLASVGTGEWRVVVAT